PAGVVIISPHEDAGALLVPRLAAAGADLERVMIIEGVSPLLPRSAKQVGEVLGPPDGPRPFEILIEPYPVGNPLTPLPEPLRLPDHFDVLKEALDEVERPRLLILDSLHDMLSAAVEANPDTLARVLGGLADLAHRRALAIVATGHFAKTRAARMLYRVRGSLSFLAAAGAAHVVAVDPDDSQRRILAPLKTIYGSPPPALAFRVADVPLALPVPPPGVITSQAELDELVQGPKPRLVRDESGSEPDEPPARCLPQLPAPRVLPQLLPDEPGRLREVAPCLRWEPAGATADARALVDMSPEIWSALNEACEWLSDYLAAGPQPAAALYTAARAHGLNPRTLRRAKRLLGIPSHKPSTASGWMWGAQTTPSAPDPAAHGPDK
ncbi:MAG: AAA family ATPase, partial [Planctomycetota bacterium]